MNIKIRKAKYNDACEIATVHADSFIAVHRSLISENSLPQFAVEGFVSRWKKRLIQCKKYTYVAEMDKKIVGLITFVFQSNRQSAEILFLYVDPHYWRMKIGRRLMVYVLKTLYRKKINRVIIWALKNNPNSRAFYESLGAVTDGIERAVTKFDIQMPLIQYYLNLENDPKFIFS